MIQTTKAFIHSCKQSLKDAKVLQPGMANKLIELTDQLQIKNDNLERELDFAYKQIEELNQKLAGVKADLLERMTAVLE